MTATEGPKGRLRIGYAKTGKIRFTSHRDLARIWERALRRADVPVSYSQGFSPRPKLSFGLALPTGFESVAEYLDVDVDVETADPAGIVSADALTAVLPVGMEATVVAAADRAAPSLQEAVESCTWLVEIDGASSDVATDGDALTALTREILDAESIEVTRTRKGRDVTDDVRPQVGDIRPGGSGDAGPTLVAELGTKPRALRPTDLLGAVRPGLVVRRVRRLHQWITVDGERVEPLDSAVIETAATNAASPTARRELCAT